MFSDVFVSVGAELTSGPHTGIPWQPGLKRGSALEADGDSMLVREEGFYFVYSQVGPLTVNSQFPHQGAMCVYLLNTIDALLRHPDCRLSRDKDADGS